MKHMKLLSFLAGIFLLVGFSSSSEADADLVAHWTFDTIKDNIVRDIAGNSDGTVVGNWQDTDLRPGLYGKALRFGDMVNLHKVEIGHTDAISLTDDFTFEYIIKPDKVDSFRTIMWKGDRMDELESINYFFDIRDGKPEMKFKDEKGRWTVYSTPQAVLEAGHWYHIIFTKQGGNIDIYVNGKKTSVRKTEDGKSKNLLPNKHNAFIGTGAAAKNQTRYLFEGLIDDIKIYRGVNVNIPNDYQEKWQHLISNNEKKTQIFEKDLKALEARRLEVISQEYATFFSQQTQKKEDVPFTVGALSSARRLVKEPEFFKRVKNFRKEAEVSAARNEYEGLNVIVFGNPSKDIDINEVKVSDLVSSDKKSRIPASNITAGYVKDVTTEDPDIPVSFEGAFPDVIMNGITSFKVEKGSFTPIFVRIYTGNARPGDYNGTVEVKGVEHSETINIKLHVYNFALPKRASLRTAFSFADGFYRQWYGVDKVSDEQEKIIHDFMLDYRLSPNDIYAGKSGDIVPNLTSIKKIENQTNFFSIKGYGNSKPISEEVLQKQVESIGKSIDKVKRAGLMDDAYYYTYDELSLHMTPEKLAAAKQINRALMSAYPDLRLMQTSPPEKEIRDLFNVWVPLFSYFDSEEAIGIINQLRERGDEIWWYPADSPQSPYPNFFLDYSVFDNRIISTLSYMYDIEGILYWRINREWLTNMDIRKEWPNAEWKPYQYHIHQGYRKYKHGMGNLMYPGPAGTLLPSPRLENLRDGIEDYDYFKELEESIKRLEKSNVAGKSTLIKDAKELLKVPGSVATSVSKWSTDPEPLLEYRNLVGETISKIHTILNQG